jgi:excisionase family DNA binding protein
MSSASFQVVSPPRRTDLTLDEVAEILRCSRYLVRRLVQDGELPAYRVGKFLRVRPEWLEEFRKAKRW